MAGDARRLLLERALDHVRANGLGDTSLRELAAALGTSHRMLLYHFGSRDALVAELVRATERAERDAHAAVVAELGVDADPVRFLRRSWERIIDPAVAPHERLFFELMAQGIAGREPAAAVVGALVTDWLDDMPEEQRVLTRLSLAVMRGLLLDVLATGDRDGASAAFEQFLVLVAGSGPTT